MSYIANSKTRFPTCHGPTIFLQPGSKPFFAVKQKLKVKPILPIRDVQKRGGFFEERAMNLGQMSGKQLIGH